MNGLCQWRNERVQEKKKKREEGNVQKEKSGATNVVPVIEVASTTAPSSAIAFTKTCEP